MNFKTTIVLIVLLAAAGVWLAVDKMSGKPETPAKTEVGSAEGRKLLDMDAADVTKVVIDRPDGKKTVLVKSGDGKWKLTEPVEAPAESFEVDGLVRDVVDMRSTGQLDSSNTGGLDHPKYVIELTGKGGKVTKVNIGDKAALGGGLYVSLDSSKTAEVVQSPVWDKLEKPVDELRGKELVTTPAADIKQIKVTKGDKTLELQKVGNDWQMTEPEKMPADDSAVSDMTWAIAGLRANSFVKPNSAEAKRARLNSAQMVVWFSAAAPSTRPTTAPASEPAGTAIKFGAYEDALKENVFASVSSFPTVAKVPASTIERFDKKPLDLRDKRVIDVDPEKVSTLTIDADLAATTQPTSRPASKKHTEITRRVEAAVLGPQLGAPATKPSAKEATTRPASGPAEARATTGPSTMPSTQPTAVAASQPATAPVELSKWELKSPAAGEADDAKVTSLLNEMHPLRAQKYLDHAATTQATTRPSGHYTLKLTTVDPGGATKSFEITLTDTQDGKLIGSYKDLTFELDHSLVSKLEEDYAKKPGAAGATALSH